MNDTLDDYPKGPGYQKGSEASRDGAKAAAPVKPTQDQRCIDAIDSAGPTGLTSDEIAAITGIELYVTRARLAGLRKAGKIVALDDRRLGGHGVRVTVYVTPRFANRPDDPQLSLLAA